MKSILSIRIFKNQDIYSKIITYNYGLLQIKLSDYTLSAYDVEISISIEK